MKKLLAVLLSLCLFIGIVSSCMICASADNYDDNCDDYEVQGVMCSESNHVFSGDCDATCNKCKYKRTVTAAHTYDNACDADCNVCGATRTPADHVYDNACDTTCNVCGAERSVAIAHTYDNDCDTTCNVCGDTRTVTHAYKSTVTKATTSKDGKIVKKCAVCGKVASTTTIKKVTSFKLSTITYTYDGKTKKPSVTVKDSAGKTLKNGTDYTVTYASGRKYVGKYTVKITLKGNYSGSKSLSFKINPKKTSVSKITAGKKSLKVTVKKVTSQATGYQIQYSTSKKFTSAKTKTISSYKTTSATIKSLKAKKTYYVRVRVYKKTSSGTKYYSAWSTYKYKKTK